MGPALDRLLARPPAGRVRQLSRPPVAYTTPSRPHQSLNPCGKLSPASFGSRRAFARCRVVLPGAGRRLSYLASHINDGHLPLVLSLNAIAPDFGLTSSGADLFDRLRYEADVNASATGAKRLVDVAAESDRIPLWLEILAFRKRLDGPDGVADVWSGLRNRGVPLPVHGHGAHVLWTTFIAAGAQRRSLLFEVCNYATTVRHASGQLYNGLYQQIVGMRLRMGIDGSDDSGLNWHGRLQRRDLVPADAARSVMIDTIMSRAPRKAYLQFKKIYIQGKDRKTYDQCIALLSEHADFKTALTWHNFLVSHNDLPSVAARTRPFVIRLLRCTAGNDYGRVGPVMRKYGETRAVTPLFSRESMNTVVGEVHGVREKNMSDAFCARLFATGAFSVDTIISGLSVFGLQAIGSVSLREIAARSETTYDFTASLAALRTASIAVRDSKFTRALQRFSAENDQSKFNVIVNSDQHPDSYEDDDLQRRLLASQLSGGNLSTAHTTLAILTMSEKDPQAASWNLLLQTYCERSHYVHVVQVVKEMLRNGFVFTDASLDCMHQHLLRSRRPGKRPVARPDSGIDMDDLDLVRTLFQMISRSQILDPRRWREMLRRYGMTNRMYSLEMLCLWLVKAYSGPDTERADAGLDGVGTLPGLTKQGDTQPAMSIGHPKHPYRRIFTPHIQRAIVSWGFLRAALPSRKTTRRLANSIDSTLEGADRDSGSARSLAHHLHYSERLSGPEQDQSSEQQPNWGRGLVLIRKLRDSGVPINTQLIREETKLRMLALYGPGRSNRLINRLAMRQNKLSLTAFVECVQQAWGSNFLVKDPALLDGSAESEELLYWALFKMFKQAYGGGRTPPSKYARTAVMPREGPRAGLVDEGGLVLRLPIEREPVQVPSPDGMRITSN